MAAFSTSEALSTLSTSVPDWIRRLDDLSSTIAQRQIELAKFTSDGKPPQPSIKNKGSTESLRPRDESTPPPHHQDDPFDLPLTTANNGSPYNPLLTTRPTAVITPPLSGSISAPVELARKLSQNTPTAHARYGMRKRKTESMVSTESQGPKYRTRSMIIVYYDSAVQAAFEDLVKFISANRNSMRKGKMNAKMDAMKRAAQQDSLEDDEDDDEEEYSLPRFTNARSPLAFSRTAGGVPRSTQALPPTIEPPIAADKDDSDEADLPPLNFVSTRNMGPPRQFSNATGGRLTSSLISRGPHGPGATLEVNDIFDVLDNGLEWCQGQCERAAHQFLRDGDCSDEIAGIKKRLLDVKLKSETEVERMKKDDTSSLVPPRREVKSRELRSPMMRLHVDKTKAGKPEVDRKKSTVADHKTVPEASPDLSIEINKKLIEADNRKLEVDTMEVDEDEGVEADIDLMPKMTFRRTRDMVR